VLRGHRADKTTFPQTIQASSAPLQTAERPYGMADRALSSQERLKALLTIGWLSRVPDTLQDARDLLPRTAPEERLPSAQQGDRDREIASQDGGVPQRWLVVFSQQA
jgi:transposase